MPLMMKFQPPVLTDAELAWMAVHSIFMIAAAVGFILLIVWMAKNLKGRQLLNWTLVFIIVGLLGSFLTFRYEMDVLGRFMWGGNVSGNFGDGKSAQAMMGQGQMMPLQNASMNQMMNMMTMMDKQCATPECQTEVKEMMLPMMEKVEDYMKQKGMMK